MAAPIAQQHITFSGFLRRCRFARIILALAAFALTFAASSAAQSQPTTGERLPVPGKPVAADYSQLSEHNIECLKTQPPQAQMEFLLGDAINHDHGATDMINKMVEDWRGHLHRTPRWQTLEGTALYSNDLRVRGAAIEINLAVNNLMQTDDTVERLVQSGEENHRNRPWNAWELGMLANRGVETSRIHELLVSYAHDPDEQTRFWAVEGLAHIGSDETIKDFLEVLRSDPSLEVKERAGCSLAKSGMLTREQRMLAVPGLMDLADDKSLDPTTRSWVFQALREITNERLPNDPGAWRSWYGNNGTKRREEFSRGEQWSVLGNN